MDPVHDRGSMDPVHESGPWTRSKERVHGPLVHVLSSPPTNSCKGLLVPARSFGLARLMPYFLTKLLLCINPFRFRFIEGLIYSQL